MCERHGKQINWKKKPHYINICSLNRSQRLALKLVWKTIHSKCCKSRMWIEMDVEKLPPKPTHTHTQNADAHKTIQRLTFIYTGKKTQKYRKIFLIWHVTTRSLRIASDVRKWTPNMQTESTSRSIFNVDFWNVVAVNVNVYENDNDTNTTFCQC